MAGVQGVAGDIEGSGEESAADVGAERGDRGNAPEQPRRDLQSRKMFYSGNESKDRGRVQEYRGGRSRR